MLIPQSSNSIRLLKLISLVNLCSRAGLEGLIRPGTRRPPGQDPSICMKDLVKAEIRLKSTFISLSGVLHKCESGYTPRQQDDLFKHLCLKALLRSHVRAGYFYRCTEGVKFSSGIFWLYVAVTAARLLAHICGFTNLGTRVSLTWCVSESIFFFSPSFFFARPQIATVISAPSINLTALIPISNISTPVFRSVRFVLLTIIKWFSPSSLLEHGKSLRIQLFVCVWLVNI